MSGEETSAAVPHIHRSYRLRNRDWKRAIFHNHVSNPGYVVYMFYTVVSSPNMSGEETSAAVPHIHFPCYVAAQLTIHEACMCLGKGPSPRVIDLLLLGFVLHLVSSIQTQSFC